MEPLRAVSTVQGSLRVNERQGGGQKQADAFRRALQQQGEAMGGDQDARRAASERPMRTALQAEAGADRKDPQHRHVDVIA